MRPKWRLVQKTCPPFACRSLMLPLPSKDNLFICLVLKTKWSYHGMLLSVHLSINTLQDIFMIFYKNVY